MNRLALGGTLAAAMALACAAGAPHLSSTSLTTTDLSGLEYESLYALLDAHNRVRVTTPEGADALLIRARGQTRSLTSPDVEGNPGRPAEGVSRPGEGGGGGGGEASAAVSGGSSGSRFAAARLYVNGSEQQDAINWLRDTGLEEIERLRILRPSEASSRFGGSGNLGAVAVILKD